MIQKKILVVDDEPTIRDVLTQMLEMSDYDAFAAENGAVGVEMFNEHSPDLIITDVLMPVMNGHEFCKSIRETSSVPIIMLSGQVDLEDEEEKRKRMGLNISMVMSKPIQMMEFLGAIEGIFQGINSEDRSPVA